MVGVGIAAGASAGNPGTVLGCVVFAALLLGVDILVARTSRLTISETEVVGRSGLLHTVKLATPVSRVQDVGISNGILGKLCGYHTVVVTTAGTGGREFVFAGFTNGAEFQQTFLDLAARSSRV